MPRQIRKRASTLELGTATRRHLAYITKHSETVATMVGAVRGIAKKYQELLQIQLQTERSGYQLFIVAVDTTCAEDKEEWRTPLDLRI